VRSWSTKGGAVAIGALEARDRTAVRSLAVLVLPPALLAGAGALLFGASPAQAQARTSALADPSANIPRTEAMDKACSGGPGAACQRAIVQAIDQARAAEGVGRLTLPPHYDGLTTADQLLVLTNLERVARGLPGFTRLSVSLDGLAYTAARSNSDPLGPTGTSWGSNWAGGEASALSADYDWMYNDGPGSPNVDCRSASVSGCWDHRRNILDDFGPHPSMGAAATTVRGVTSMTELLSSAPPETLEYLARA
jgi:hypothetical protein